LETVLIACKTMENEVTQALDRAGISYSVYWIESGKQQAA